MHETIRVSGTKTHVQQLADALRERQVEGIEVSDPRPAKGNLFGRAPLGQVGLFEILISVAASLVSSAAYDGIKRIIAGFSKEGKVEAVTTIPKSEPKPKPKSAGGSEKNKIARLEAPKRRPKK